MMKNTYIYLIIIIVVLGAVIFWMGQDKKTDDTNDALSLVTLTPTPLATPEPSAPAGTPTPRSIKSTPKPSPGIVVKEVNQYQSLVDWLDPLNRRITLDENCTSSVPSQVAYPNNTQIMIDNTLSAEPRVLEIGGQDYPVEAHGWILTVLSRSELPAQLKMFCGSMELGQLDLE